MVIVNESSLDFSVTPLSRKKRAAIRRLMDGHGYTAYVILCDGRLIKYDLSSSTKRGYTQRTLTPDQYVLLRTPR